jgi:hypothetical protein
LKVHAAGLCMRESCFRICLLPCRFAKFTRFLLTNLTHYLERRNGGA